MRLDTLQEPTVDCPRKGDSTYSYPIIYVIDNKHNGFEIVFHSYNYCSSIIIERLDWMRLIADCL